MSTEQTKQQINERASEMKWVNEKDTVTVRVEMKMHSDYVP